MFDSSENLTISLKQKQKFIVILVTFRAESGKNNIRLHEITFLDENRFTHEIKDTC